MSNGAIIGATTAAAAAARRRRMLQEEEDMTPYSKDDLDGWEFKIVRSDTARFRRREAVEQLRKEEAQAGWEMVEKFDNNRIRFKRRVDQRNQDAHRQLDPYRTHVGVGAGNIVAVIVGVVLLAGLVAFFLANGESQSAGTPWTLFTLGGILALMGAVVVIRRGRR